VFTAAVLSPSERGLIKTAMQVYVTHVSGYPGRAVAAALQGEDGIDDIKLTGSVFPEEMIPTGVAETALVRCANCLVAVRRACHEHYADRH